MTKFAVKILEMPIKDTVYFRNVYFTFAKFVKIFKQKLSFASKRAFCNFT